MNAAIRDSDGLAGFSGVSDMLTGPWMRAEQAMRVFSARPSRSSVERSSSVIADRFSIPCLTHTGSAPQTPIRQPDSIDSPPASAASSSDMPGLATTRLPSGSNETSGAPALTARWEAIERPAARSASGLTDGAAAAAPPAWALNARSFANVRSTQPPASAIAAARTAQSAAAGAAPSETASRKIGPPYQ